MQRVVERNPRRSRTGQVRGDDAETGAPGRPPTPSLGPRRRWPRIRRRRLDSALPDDRRAPRGDCGFRVDRVFRLTFDSDPASRQRRQQLPFERRKAVEARENHGGRQGEVPGRDQVDQLQVQADRVAPVGGPATFAEIGPRR